MDDTQVLGRRLAAAVSRHDRRMQLMEVCGTHTVAIFRAGIRSLLPPGVRLLSGPGCPVCVTAAGEVERAMHLARVPGVLLAVFGDMLRVPGRRESLAEARAEGAGVRVVYSPRDALELARRHPELRVVFWGVGFETTAPGVAAALLEARATGADNFLVYCAHKLVPPALEALLATGEVRVDGFILPGHVSTVLGTAPYAFLAERHGVPAVVAGFEPTDLLLALELLLRLVERGEATVVNAYPRAVRSEGNPAARAVLDRVFRPVDARWRGLGEIPGSGLALREEFAAHDAARQFALPEFPDAEPRGCRCGEVLRGAALPPECPLFDRRCTPVSPVGPCMVSSEGSCAAYHRYGRRAG